MPKNLLPAISRTLSPVEWAMLGALSLLWGGSFFFTGIAVGEITPLTFVAMRVGGAAIILNVTIFCLGYRLPRDVSVWAAFAGMAILNNIIPFCLIVWGQTHISSGLASILNATTPLATVVVAHCFTSDEKMTGNRLAGILPGFIGVAIMVRPDLLHGFDTDLLARLAVLAAAFSYALAGIFGRRFCRFGVSPLITATGQVTAATVLLSPLALIAEKPWLLPPPSLTAWGAVLAIAAFSTALAYVIYFRILASAGATNLLLVTFLIPVSAILLGASFLHERLEARSFLGMAMIAGGLAAIDGRLWRLWPRAV